MPYTKGTIDKYLVVSCGTTYLVTICPDSSELAKQWNFADMETTMSVKCTRDSVMDCLVIFICHADTFSSYIFWANLLFIFDLFMLPPLHSRLIMFSGCPSVRIIFLPNRLFDQPWFFSVCLSVCPSAFVSEPFTENACKEWHEIWHAGVSWPPQNCLYFGHVLSIFLILAPFWPSENSHIWIFWAFSGE